MNKLEKRHYQNVSADLRRNILTFYQDLRAPFDTKRHRKKWKDTVQKINELKQIEAGLPKQTPKMEEDTGKR
jgi:hypothetical protein